MLSKKRKRGEKWGKERKRRKSIGNVSSTS